MSNEIAKLARAQGNIFKAMSRRKTSKASLQIKYWCGVHSRLSHKLMAKKFRKK